MLNDVLRSHSGRLYTAIDAASTLVHACCGRVTVMQPMTPEEKFAERIKAACNTAGTSAEPSAMARKTKLSKQLCFKYLHAQTKMDYIPAWAIWQIADALKVSARWLFLGEGAPWNAVATTNDENEVLKAMRELSPEAIHHIIEATKGQLAKEKVAPETGRFAPTPVKRAQRH